MSYCFLNGEFLPLSKAAIAVTDRGFLLGDGFFTTVRCYHGRPFALAFHWQRLMMSAQLFLLTLPMDYDLLKKTCEHLIAMNKLTQHQSSLRITFTRGSSIRGLNIPVESSPCVLIQNTILPATPRTPIKLTSNTRYPIAPSPLRKIKPLAYTERILARHEAKLAGYDDTLLFNTRQELIGSSCANIFLVNDNQLYTSPADSGSVNGIMQHTIMQLAEENHIPCHTRALHLTDLSQAQEVFLTNSLIEIQAVYSYNNTQFGIDKKAAITQRIMQALQHTNL